MIRSEYTANLALSTTAHHVAIVGAHFAKPVTRATVKRPGLFARLFGF